MTLPTVEHHRSLAGGGSPQLVDQRRTGGIDGEVFGGEPTTGITHSACFVAVC